MSEQFDIAVIGAGPGGYIAALKAAQLGAKVAVIEKHHLGGTCLNYGCIPSKALLASAQLLHSIHNAPDLGVAVSGSVEFDWAKIQKRKDGVLKKLRGGIKGLFGARGVKLFQGSAQLAGPGKIQISSDAGTSETISAKNTIIASGSVPMRIPGWPDDPQLVCTSDEALHWKDLPKRLLIVGGGVIGCEFACMMHEYGVDVTVVEMLDSLLPGMEAELGQALEQRFAKRGIKIHTAVKVESISQTPQGISACISGLPDLDVDRVLVATGRRANTESLGLDTVGISTDRGFIRVNARMQTSVPGYYCIGDANGQCLLAHAASAQGVTAVEDALGQGKDFDSPIPSAVYTFPEVAAVGLTSEQATQQGIPISVGQFPIGHLGKAMAVGEEFGFARIVRHRTDNTLLGVHLIGHNATEIIEAATAMLGLKANAHDLADMIFAHPTIGEAVKEAAEDSFQQALHLPPRKHTRMMADIV
jgi:dihydrolipoamide dehydrogenase